ncbi:MAG TPA: aminotransferase class V-fold PLP-dependent enzyme [Planctomycetota bacterium]|nr:aminotransferase class V-fold PLP-dependent enzyme [Planctomycetota bacterium]
MYSRRDVLGAAALALAPVRLDPERIARALEPFAGRGDGSPERDARDEEAWLFVQQAFTVDRSLVNLNNGGVSPSPALVQAAMKRHLDYSNQCPPHHMWQVLEKQREGVRQRLARLFGCDGEEIAITRNASESLQTCQLGLDLEPGDEVLTSTQDYPRMLTTFEQRARREGIVLRKVSLPVPAEDDAEVVRRFAEAIGPRTRLMLVCHVINLTGQILPVRELVALGRRHGVPVVIDGAHAFAHFPFSHADLDCDYYGTSLHKWLFAPHGTGLLYVRREKIASLWPLMGAPEGMDADVRKFEEIGTHPAANAIAIAEAVTFHEGIGPARKAARLRYLRERWARRLMESDRVRLLTSLDPRFSCGIATVAVEGIDTARLGAHLWERHRILTTPILHPEVEGLRISPSVYTTLEELDRFCEAVETAIREGLPA